MKKLISILCAAALCCALLPAAVLADGADFSPEPQTAYAAQFIQLCEGQQWFINEVERLLNAEQKTLDAITDAGDLSGIKSIGLRDRGIVGAIPAAVGELSELRYLFLSGNHLSGSIPDGLFALPRLQNIDLGENDYSGTIPAEFGSMAALNTLVLSGNDYTGTVPDAILANSRIAVLNLMDNQLSGGIPVGIGGMTGLQYLNLSENELGGEIPDLSALSCLVSLSLWDCGLTGELPETLFALTRLQILDLSGNRLTGEISPSLADLAELQYLALDGNLLRGTLPDAFSAAGLSKIHLENNFLRGTVPDTLKARYDGGAGVWLNNNYMTGDVLRSMVNNADNFTDGAESAQYQLSSVRAAVNISKTGRVNLYPLLQNTPLASGGSSKALLRPDEYVVSYDSSRVELTSDADGIYVMALTDIPAKEQLTITVQIRDNDGSAYSALALTLNTALPAGGGGGGGASSSEPVRVDHHLYINGFPDGSFGPSLNVTREQTAKLLIDALQKDTLTPDSPDFPDVPDTRWSFAWIEAAADEGYVQGYTDGSFAPASPITRAEMAAILVRAAAKEGFAMNADEKQFSDVEDGKWYCSYIRQAVQYGLINGYEDGTFRPDRYITRAEAVAMINRMLQRNYETATELHSMTCPFPDVPESHWAYGDIMEASVVHRH